MNKIISLLFLFFCLNSFSQATKEIKISQKKLSDVKELSDVISEVPKDCKVQSYVISYKVGNDLREFTCMTNGIGKEVVDLMAKKEKDKWFFIEKIKSGCENSPKGRFKIIID